MKTTSKKHFISYAPNVWLLTICLSALFAILSNKNIDILLLYLAVIISAFFIYSFSGIFTKRSTSWVFENGRLTTKSGWLPWSKKNFYVDIDQIYEAYYSTSFLGNIFGYGGITIRRTDGITSTLHSKTMTNHEKMVRAINESLEEHKALSKEVARPVEIKTDTSLAEELKKLSDLKKEGIISEEEFLDLKKKNIQKFS